MMAEEDKENTKQNFVRKLSKRFKEFRKSLKKTDGCGVSDSFIQSVPPKPLSVLEIKELLIHDSLQVAYSQLLSLLMEFQREREALGEKTPPVKLTNKEKDLSLLYETLRDRVTDIVRHSCEKHSKDDLEDVVRIIQEEEKRKSELGGIGEWKVVWKNAVQDNVMATVKRVQLDSFKKKEKLLAVYLDNLGNAIVKLLEKAKTELVNLYPPCFNVFETYTSSCHEVIEKHLVELIANMEFKDCDAMLNFINQINGKKILDSLSLLQEMEKLPDGIINQFREKYCICLQEEFKTLLDRIVKIEQEEVWEKKAKPKTEDERLPNSEILVNICKEIALYAENSEKFDAELKMRVLCCCLEGLKDFTTRFEKEFAKLRSFLLGSDALDCGLWVQYHVVYTNSFSLLKEHLEESYIESCPDQVTLLGKEIDGLLLNLRQALLKQFKVETEPFMEIMMTKEWLNTDNSFNEITNRIESYSCRYMRPLPAQSFANALHYHVVKEYILRLLKKKYSCKGKKNGDAAEKIRHQWNELKGLFSEMGSTLEWLQPLGDQLSEIIEQENEKDIIPLLEPLIEKYPDISEAQLSAILYFRGVGKHLGKNPVIQHFTKLKKSSGKKNNEHALFSDIKQACDTSGDTKS